MDIFLLWLLYRFMKPQNILKDGNTEASALLFAHDGREAQKMLLNFQTSIEEEKKERLLLKKHKDFFDFVINDWIAEITLET